MSLKHKLAAELKISDPARRQQLRLKIRQQESEGHDNPIVSLDDFFVGNEDAGSIGCNTSPPLTQTDFYQKLKEIHSLASVSEIWVEISDAEENNPEPLTWPFSDRIFIFTSATQEEVAQWLEPLQVDEMNSDYINSRLNSIKLEAGMKIYQAWWD